MWVRPCCSVVIELCFHVRLSTFEAFILPAFPFLVKRNCPTILPRICFAFPRLGFPNRTHLWEQALLLYRFALGGEIGSFVLSGLDSTAIQTRVKGFLPPILELFLRVWRLYCICPSLVSVNSNLRIVHPCKFSSPLFSVPLCLCGRFWRPPKSTIIFN